MIVLGDSVVDMNSGEKGIVVRESTLSGFLVVRIWNDVCRKYIEKQLKPKWVFRIEDIGHGDETNKEDRLVKEWYCEAAMDLVFDTKDRDWYNEIMQIDTN